MRSAKTLRVWLHCAFAKLSGGYSFAIRGFQRVVLPLMFCWYLQGPSDDDGQFAGLLFFFLNIHYTIICT